MRQIIKTRLTQRIQRFRMKRTHSTMTGRRIWKFTKRRQRKNKKRGSDPLTLSQIIGQLRAEGLKDWNRIYQRRHQQKLDRLKSERFKDRNQNRRYHQKLNQIQSEQLKDCNCILQIIKKLDKQWKNKTKSRSFKALQPWTRSVHGIWLQKYLDSL